MAALVGKPARRVPIPNILVTLEEGVQLRDGTASSVRGRRRLFLPHRSARGEEVWYARRFWLRGEWRGGFCWLIATTYHRRLLLRVSSGGW